MSQPTERHRLTEKQRLFAEEYLKDHNATQAAIRAGYSAKTARAIGCENLTKPHIKAEIEAKLGSYLAEISEEAKAAVLEGHDVLVADSALATSDLTEFIQEWTPHGPLWKNLKDLPPAQRQAIQSLQYDPDKRVLNLKLHSKHPSLERLAKHHRLFDPESQEQDPEDIPEIAARAAAWLEGLCRKMKRATEDVSVGEVVAMLRRGPQRQT